MIIPAAADKCAHCGTGQPPQVIGVICIFISSTVGFTVAALLDLGFLWHVGFWLVGAFIGVPISHKLVKAMTGDDPS
jgi:hypothetical protein